ncbi:glycosyl transferase [Novosphingobium marinum]|uniref:Glycosyltransferase involved in cell wall biosynthesis n=1 Tax=Novosphingobium marinum TaxID=1514948 RepID=A0A7Y9XWT4_9SPHN|nr:glycosyltransferase family 2 protein [Novosphingobium marinum]NYH96002.1 glycosyltransferase involved in cell wall biosynthesis [Novosphingobium marinum]GGC31667.1 glycosyl transferase [Novosphingobium marinum]
MTTIKGPYYADVVVPCFNEEEALPETAPVILDFFRTLVADRSNRLTGFRLILVNDGSSDGTWSLIERLCAANPEVEGVMLSRNFGHQSAMLAGLTIADADVILTMDADLQDDIEAVRGMISAYEDGAHLALGVRNDRSSDGRGKSGSANAYYRLLSALGIRIIENHADFRLMSRTALAALLQYREVNLFLRGLIPTLGFPVTLVPYARKPRTAGETKYTLRKMLRLALDGITSFTVMPLRIIAATGAVIFLGTILASLFFLYVYFAHSSDIVPGWASTVLPMLFLGGVQLLSIGVLGEYVGKIYLETKRRPRFIIQETTSEALDANVRAEIEKAEAA